MATTLSITPTRFIASSGKLDSTKRYIRKSSTPDFNFVIGPNMDVSGGGLHYEYPDGTVIADSTYDGNFSGVDAVGIETS